MDSIYFEKQEGQLCAQHCLNNLLQGPYFTAVDLADFAHGLDEAEKATMAEGDLTPSRLHHLMRQPSTNMDDSGFFSIQVISKALRVWNLDSVPLSSPAMKQTMEDPTSQTAFICNHDYHWLTVRKLGLQWFNLDSLLRKPKLVSDTYLSLFLTQLQMEGALPPCEADQLLTLIPVKPEPPTASPTPGGQPSCTGCASKKERTSEIDDEDESFALDLATAMSASLLTTAVTAQEQGGTRPCELREMEGNVEPGCTSKRGRTSEIDGEDESFALDLATAMSASLLTTAVTAQEQGGTRPCELREMEGKEEPGCTSKRGRTSEIDGEDESFALYLATAMSASLVKTTVTAQEQGGTVAAIPCGLREVEEEEEPDMELAAASLDDSTEPEEPARPPPGEHPTTSLYPTKPLPDEELRQRRLLHLGELKESSWGEKPDDD